MNLPALESALAAIGLKATLVTIMALLVVRLAQRAPASLRHRVVSTAFAAILLLPAVVPLVPARVISVPTPQRLAAPANDVRVVSPPIVRSSVPVSRERLAVNPTDIALAVYAAGVILLGASLLLGIRRLHRLHRQARVSVSGTELGREMARHAGVRDRVEVAISPELVVPITFGTGRAVILLPGGIDAWTESELLRAVRHEVEHIARRDWFAQVLSRLACAVYWPIPFVWVLWRTLRLESERACDDAVIRNHGGAMTYAEQLVSLAHRIAGRERMPALAMCARSSLDLRVEAILDGRRPRAPLSRFASLAIAILTMTGMLALAPLKVMSAPLQAGENADPLDLALLNAAERSDVEEIRALIDRGAHANAAIPGDGTPLIAASRKGHVEAMKLLLEEGADVNLGVAGDGNPLIMASAAGQFAAARYLLDHGASIETVVPGDENPLIGASAKGHQAVVRLLIERGANVNARVWADSVNGHEHGGEWRSALSVARRNGHAAVEQLLLAAGARQ